MAKSNNKIIKLAAVALIGYGVYKAFFAEDNDVGDYSSTSQQSGYKPASVVVQRAPDTSYLERHSLRKVLM